MQTCHLVVDADGRVTIPDARPGQSVTVQVEALDELPFLTFRTAQTDAEREAVIEDILQMAGRARELLADDLPRTDELYGDDGLPLDRLPLSRATPLNAT
jgi:hypothetical protein